MREAQEDVVWGRLRDKWARIESNTFAVGGGTTIDLAHPCTVLGGRNGAGKSRLLRRLEHHLSTRALLLDLHHLTQQTLMLYRSRDDFEAMTDEVDPLSLSADHLDDVQKIIGRRYDSIEWFSIEFEPEDPDVLARFQWNGPAAPTLVPFFRVRYRGHSYTSSEMGLGEFSIHLLFWILELLREEKDRVLLLDEPDAYLPPVGVRSLLARVLRVCLKRDWSVVLSTHSEEMIALAVEHGGFTLLDVDATGQTRAMHASEDPMVATTLLTRPPVDSIAFAEDESACAMARGLLKAVDPVRERRSSFLWGGGDGYLRELHDHIPRPPRPDVRFAYVFDGDQRGSVSSAKPQRWGHVFLPTVQDPDELMQGLAHEVERIAAKLHVAEDYLHRFLASIEAADCHDWVNKLGKEFGRPQVLQALPALWAEIHPDDARAFVNELLAVWD